MGVVAALLAAPSVVPAAAAQGAGADGPVVLQTGGSVRQTGLNGAGAALVGDAGTVFSNPAGLATIRHVALEAGYFTAPFDAYQSTAALGWRLGQFTFGLGAKYFSFGTEPEIVPDPATGGLGGMPTGASVSAGEFLGVGSAIYRFGVLAIGGSAKFIRQRIADIEVSAVSGDIGLAIAVFDIAALGFAVQNVGGNWKDGSPLTVPRLSRVGFTMNYVDPQGAFRLLSTLEGQWQAGRSARVVFGLEGGLVIGGVGLLGRSALGSRPAGSDRSGITYGLTVEIARLSIDYAFEPREQLGDASQRIGARVML